MNVIVPAKKMHVLKNLKTIDMKATETNNNLIRIQKIRIEHIQVYKMKQYKNVEVLYYCIQMQSSIYHT